MNKKVIYKRVVAEGFQSFGSPVAFKLDRYGLNLIKGVNGAGKSTIFNAILWCEYGGNMKKSVETWEDRRPETYRGTRVVIDRTDGEFDYRIARHLNFKGTTLGLKGGSKLMIFKKPVSEPKFTQEHLVGDGLHKADMQRIIESQLGLDEKTFLNSILFGQRMLSLIEVKDAEKRKLFEELFDVSFVDALKDIAQEERSKLDNDLVELGREYETLRLKIERNKKDIEEYGYILENFKQSHQKRLESALKRLQDDKDELQKHINREKEISIELAKYDFDKLEELEVVIKTKASDMVANQDLIYKLERSLRRFDDEINQSKLKEGQYSEEVKNVTTTCPTCGQALPESEIKKVKTNLRKLIKTEEDVRKELEKKRKEEEKRLQDLQKFVVQSEQELEELKQKKNDVEKSLSKAIEYKAELRSLSGIISKYMQTVANSEREVENIKNEKPPQLNIKQKEKEVKDFEKRIEEIKTAMADKESKLERVNWWMKKGFGSGGLKSFVFNSMLQQLNKYAFNYAKRLGFGVQFSIDMTKASKPFKTLIFEGDFVRDYEDLSGGQRQRIDIVIAFAMHDLISRNSDINILVLDELFEGLDNQGVEVAFDLIRQKADDKAVYIISHSDIVDSLNARSIYVRLDDLKNTVIDG